MQRLATALRSLLRFWHLQGLISGPLDQAVPKVANRRPGLPRPLESRQVRALLASCDGRTAGGRRDLAMLFVRLNESCVSLLSHRYPQVRHSGLKAEG